MPSKSSTGSLERGPDFAILIAARTALNQPLTDNALRDSAQTMRCAREPLADRASLPVSFRI